MKSNKISKLAWRKLDNSAKIFPMATGKKYSTVFRLSVVLKEVIDPKILYNALIQTLDKYELFKVRMKMGLFWYYLEENTKKPIIEEERDYPCKYIEPSSNNGYLFKVTYFNNKVNIDIFHSLTDGNGGITFFREIIYTYLENKYKNELNQEERKIRKIEEYNIEDSYIKNYNKDSKTNSYNKWAYELKGRKIKLGAISAIHQIINLEDLKVETQKYNVTVTQYLTSVLIYSIYTGNYIKNKGRKPIKMYIPLMRLMTVLLQVLQSSLLLR